MITLNRTVEIVRRTLALSAVLGMGVAVAQAQDQDAGNAGRNLAADPEPPSSRHHRDAELLVQRGGQRCGWCQCRGLEGSVRLSGDCGNAAAAAAPYLQPAAISRQQHEC